MQALSHLMGFLEKKIRKSLSNPTSINAVSIWSRMECGVSYLFHNTKIKRRNGIFFYISLYFPWNTWNSMYRFFRKDMKQISMLFRTWCCQDCTWGVLCQILSFRSYWHFRPWQQPDLVSMFPPWLLFYPIFIIPWWILWTTWIV